MSDNIRLKLRVEFAIQDLTMDNLEKLHQGLLRHYDFNPEIPERDNKWEARLLQNNGRMYLASKEFVQEYFLASILAGYHWDYREEKWIRLIRQAI